jgi:coenzyme F420-0:L-glutamate ligase/coenzyme F420-1:gamma-L-glutamate ligase
MAGALELRALEGIPEIEPGDDLASILQAALHRHDIVLERGDILVVAQKIISKAENRFLDLRSVSPSARALEIASLIGKEPQFVEAVLAESCEIVRTAPNTLITRHRAGYVMANAGIDRSNVPGDEHTVLLLPKDCDASAAKLRARFPQPAPGIVISDSFGRPWREGVVNVALGVAGVVALIDRRGGVDREGRTLQVTQIALADAIAAAAGIVMGETTEGTPAVWIRGLAAHACDADGGSARLLRPAANDLFK